MKAADHDGAGPLSPEAARAFVQRLLSAVNAHDAAAIATLCDPDVVWQDPAAPHPLHGPDGVRAFHERVMFPALPDVRVQLLQGPLLDPQEPALAMRLRIEGTMTGPLRPPGFAPTGGRLSFETAEFAVLRAGRLLRHTVVLDMMALARQIGAVPPAGTLGDRLGVGLQHAWAAVLRARHAREAS